MSDYRIGEVAVTLGMSVDTLRYYERIGLVPDVSRTESGIRRYDGDDLARLRFIKRAQMMNFSLSEIGALLEFRRNPGRSKKYARELAMAKLGEVDERLRSLEDLRKELGRLVRSCPMVRDGCAIISGIENQGSAASRPRLRRKP